MPRAGVIVWQRFHIAVLNPQTRRSRAHAVEPLQARQPGYHGSHRVSTGKLATHVSSSAWVSSRSLLLVVNSTLSNTVPFGHSVLRHVAFSDRVSTGKLATHVSSSAWVSSRSLLLVVNSTLSNTVPFGHSVLRHVAFSKLGLRSPAGRSTRRKQSRSFPSAGPN